MTEVSPIAIRRQIAHLSRCLADIAFRMWIAQLEDNNAEYILLKVEYSRVEYNRNRLSAELRELVVLQNEQARAIEEVEQILELGY